ncbi:Uncharacterised protein [uncultured archaeon]|nr:Uncharacterised protein [uncultured archaeon]
MYWIGYLLGNLIPIISFADAYKAVPSNITIGYNEKVTIQVGVVDMKTGEFAPPFYLYGLTARYLSFSAEFPQGNPGGAWFVNFDPPLIYQTPTNLLVTNATISLASPPSASNPIQSTNITIKIVNMWVAGDLWFAGKQPGFEPLYKKIFWVLGAFTGGYGFLSGKVLPEYINVSVLVTVKPYHSVKIQAVQPEKLTPNEITSIPILIENQGNYNDTFSFQIKTKTGYPLILTNNVTNTLQPGEQGQAIVGIAVPANIIDTGTLHSLIIETYSTEQPNTSIATQRIFLETQGFYFSEQNIVYTLVFGFFILFVLFLLIYWRRKVSGKIYIKPEKPWKIPEEQQYLQELKQTDKKAYEQERVMMKDEYKSASRWYNDYRKALRKKPEEKKLTKPLSTIFKKAKKTLKITEKPEKKPAKPLSVIFKKSEKPLKTEQKKKQPSIPAEEITLEKALAKIRKEQEKQLRKMNI